MTNSNIAKLAHYYDPDDEQRLLEILLATNYNIIERGWKIIPIKENWGEAKWNSWINKLDDKVKRHCELLLNAAKHGDTINRLKEYMPIVKSSGKMKHEPILYAVKFMMVSSERKEDKEKTLKKHLEDANINPTSSNDEFKEVIDNILGQKSNFNKLKDKITRMNKLTKLLHENIYEFNEVFNAVRKKPSTIAGMYSNLNNLQQEIKAIKR